MTSNVAVDVKADVEKILPLERNWNVGYIAKYSKEPDDSDTIDISISNDLTKDDTKLSTFVSSDATGYIYIRADREILNEIKSHISLDDNNVKDPELQGIRVENGNLTFSGYFWVTPLFDGYYSIQKRNTKYMKYIDSSSILFEYSSANPPQRTTNWYISPNQIEDTQWYLTFNNTPFYSKAADIKKLSDDVVLINNKLKFSVVATKERQNTELFDAYLYYGSERSFQVPSFEIPSLFFDSASVFMIFNKNWKIEHPENTSNFKITHL